MSTCHGCYKAHDTKDPGNEQQTWWKQPSLTTQVGNCWRLVPLELTPVSELLFLGFCLLMKAMWCEKDQERASQCWASGVVQGLLRPGLNGSLRDPRSSPEPLGTVG